MSFLSRKYYVYLVFSFKSLYVGKGSGDRVRESMGERDGLFHIVMGRYYSENAAYRAEKRLIACLRTFRIPLQNGRAPRKSLWERLTSSRRKTRKTSVVDTILGLIFLVLVIWWLVA